MTNKDDKKPSNAQPAQKKSQKQVREERLKQSLRANLQRRKAKARALNSQDKDSSQQ